jgi:acetyl-CoA carboxylase carboxyltransferase component
VTTAEPLEAATEAESPPAPLMGDTFEERVSELAELRRLAGETRPGATERQHAKGKATIRERIDRLVDPGSFTELQTFVRHNSQSFGMEADRPFTDGVVTGWGTVDGRPVAVYGSDFRVFGGSLGAVHAAKVHQLLDHAARTGMPVVAINDGGGARIQEGVAALHGYGGIFRRNAALSGVVPQISVILGPCAGGAVYSPALTDFTFMVTGVSTMYITGPDVVEAVTGEKVSHEQLGGAAVHSATSGVAAAVYPDEESCLDEVRYLLGLLPANNLEPPEAVAADDPPDRLCPELTRIVPLAPNRGYDVREVIRAILDNGDAFEISGEFARNIVCMLGRIAGETVGVVANQPEVLAGALDIAASEKAARFVRFCDAFTIPLLTLVDVPGFLPGTDQEHAGIIRRGAKLLYAYCEATVPRVCVVLRKSYGGAYIVMDSKSIGADLVLAWPSCEIAVMGAEGAANIIFRKQIAASPAPERTRQAMVREYRDQMLNPLVAAEQGYVDDIIEPERTREAVARAFAVLRTKRAPLSQRKHANMPL